ncbi:TPR domain protein, putative component of TonB system [Fimbriiglobus ruber]|uniref:TPR domain protein, putative component of TonB system n=1 Tax=Fimbriiglobus ruber TaxID=1908690 RepID=A0A225DFU2_9BACT|nr:TPR domain protein, putative component of TonB system [Fimbriiglobus ruber]
MVVFALLAIGGVGAWWAVRPTPPAPPEVSLDGADPEVRETIDAARKTLLTELRSADAWGRYGMVLRAHNFESAADECFAEAGRRDTDDARWPYYRGLYAEFNQTDGVPRGLPDFRRAWEIGHPDPDYRNALRMRLAETLADRGQLDEAERLFRGDEGHAPGPRELFGLGLIAAARDDLPTATARLTSAVDHPTVRQKAAVQLAALARRSGDTAAASRYQVAAASAPKDPDWPDLFVRDLEALQVGLKARLFRASALQEEGQTRESLKLLLDLCRTHPSAEIYYKTAGVLGLSGDHARAEQSLRESLKRDPDFAPAHYLLAVTLYIQGSARWTRESDREVARAMLRESVEHFRTSIERKPDSADAHRCLGGALLLLGEKAEGVKQLRLAIAVRPERYDGYLYLGTALMEQGERDEGLRNLRSAEQLLPPGDSQPRQLIESLIKGKN